MSPEVAAALIGGASSIVGPIIVYCATQWYRNRSLRSLTSGRRSALIGIWEGTLKQQAGPEGKPSEMHFTLQLSVAGKVVSGEATYQFTHQGKSYRPKWSVRGGLVHDRFLQFEYHNVEETVVQFGSIVVELDETGKRLSGRFLGYGRLAKRLVFGKIELEKRVP